MLPSCILMLWQAIESVCWYTHYFFQKRSNRQKNGLYHKTDEKTNINQKFHFLTAFYIVLIIKKHTMFLLFLAY